MRKREDLIAGAEDALDTADRDISKLKRELSKVFDAFGPVDTEDNLPLARSALDKAVGLAMNITEDLEEFGRWSGLRPEHKGRTTARPAKMGVSKKKREKK